MNNKILVKVMVPELGEEYELFIPTNEYVSVVTNLIINDIVTIVGIKKLGNKPYSLINKKTTEIYDASMIIRDTSIENSTELILM